MLAQRRYRFDDFTLDLKRGALYRGATEVRLRPKSFAVLQALVERHGELVSKDELLERVWGRTVVTDGAITQSLIDVRRAIGDDSQEIVRTVPRRGYIFTSPVTTADDEALLPPSMPSVAVSSAPLQGHAVPSRPAPDQSPAAAQPARSPRMLTAVLLLVVLGTLAWWWGTAAHVETMPSNDTAAAAADTTRKTIAVLPFVNLTGDPDGEYVSDGIAEGVLHLLAQSGGLRVIARTSSFAFKGQSTSIEDIASKLHVDYVVEGSVRRAGPRLRVNVQLVDASSSSPVWSQAYDRDVRDLLAVQDDIARQIATELRSNLGDPSRASRHTPDPAAHDAYLRARFFFNRRLADDLDKAERAFQEALRLDPRFARAWSGLAGVYGVSSGDLGVDVAALLRKEKAAIDRAIALDPELADARIRASSYYFRTGDLARAKREAELAFKLAPDDPAVLWWQADRLMKDGRMDEAIEIERRVVAADPASRVTRVNFANSLLAAGRLEEARAEFLNFEEMGAQPDPYVAVDLARIDLLQGHYAKALAAAEGWAHNQDRDFVLAVAGEALGNGNVARAAESRLLASHSSAAAVRLAELYAFSGQVDDAFHWMNVGYERLGPNPYLTDQWQWLYQLKLSPFLRPLHADARWAAMRERGLEPVVLHK